MLVISALRGRAAHIWGGLRSSLWFVPGIMTILAVGLALLMLRVDALYEPGWLDETSWIYSRSAAGARDLLSTVAASMVTVAGLAFSILVVALQLASAQFGPRVLRNFMRDRGNQMVLGTFIATFLYCLIVMRTISDDVSEPRLAVAGAVPLAVASLAVLIYFLHHTAASIQAPHVIASVARELDTAIDRMYPSRIGEPAPVVQHSAAAADDEHVICAARGGYVQTIDADTLIGVARRHDVVVRVLCRPGEFMVRGQPLMAVFPPAHVSARAATAARRTVILGGQRTAEQDVEFSFEQLVQVALRALSTSYNDPFTAIGCIDHLGAALHHLVKRQEPPVVRVDEEGRPRLIAYGASMVRLFEIALVPLVEAARRGALPLQRLAELSQRIAEMADELTPDVRGTLATHTRLIWRHADEVSSPAARDEIRARCREALRALSAAPDDERGELLTAG